MLEPETVALKLAGAESFVVRAWGFVSVCSTYLLPDFTRAAILNLYVVPAVRFFTLHEVLETFL